MMNDFESKLAERMPASDALALLKEIASRGYVLLGLDGFRLRADGTLESNLDWTLDLSLLKQLNDREKFMLAIEFIRNRADDVAFFEICAEKQK